MNDYLLPPINVTGQFRLDTPLDTLFDSTTQYTVSGVRTIQEMLDNDEDVETFVYTNQGFTNTEYTEAVQNNTPIVIFTNAGGETFYIPANVILSIPDYSGTRFHEKTIAIDLNAVPEAMDLDFLKTEISDLIESMAGITPTIELLQTSQTYILTQSEYDLYEVNRNAKITSQETCRSKLIYYEQIIANQLLKINNLVKLLNP